MIKMKKKKNINNNDKETKINNKDKEKMILFCIQLK